MKKWIIIAVAVLVALAAYVVAGPYITVRAISEAAKTQDAGALARQVDFPALRASLKLQLQDRMLRKAGMEAQASPFSAFGLSIANGLVGAGVDAMVTPLGLRTLMEGHKVYKHFDDGLSGRDPQTPSSDPLHQARYRYESLSRFTATVADEDGDPVVFVLTREGLVWRLTDIKLPR